MRPALALLVLVAACSDFEPYNRLSKLRVLAIKSEPALPAPGETATLTPLVYAPPGVSVQLAWSWCLLSGAPTAGFPCLVGEDEVPALAGGAPRSYDLGTGDTAAFTHDLDPSRMAALCAEGGLDCAGGMPITVRMRATAGDADVDTVLTLRLRFAPEHAANANPALGGLTATVDGTAAALDAVELPRDVEVPIGVELTDTEAESYVRDDGANARESLVLTWFVETGDTESQRTAFIEGFSALAGARANVWTLPVIEEEPRDEASLTVVVRDDRGGVGWTTRTASLGGAR
jgi:hypothetical protein